MIKLKSKLCCGVNPEYICLTCGKLWCSDCHRSHSNRHPFNHIIKVVYTSPLGDDLRRTVL